MSTGRLYLYVAAALALGAIAMPIAARGPYTDTADTKATTVCAACHGATGTSVSDTIPNLAGQQAKYIEAQLRDLRAGKRKNAIMNAIAAQLHDDEIASLAAYFSALPPAGGAAKSQLLPHIAKTAVTFPQDYKTSFTKYATVDFPDRKQVRYFYANAVALAAARAGEPLPDGSVLFVEVYSARLGAESEPLVGADGFFVPDRITGYTAMARNPGWGANFPGMLRNGNWNYAVFTPEKTLRPAVNQAECLACHKGQEKLGYTFTLKQLVESARAR